MRNCQTAILLSDLIFSSVAPWGSEVDEYENMDDVGYCRKPVMSQTYFMEHELDLSGEEGSEGYFVHKAKASGLQAADSGYDSHSDEEHLSTAQGSRAASATAANDEGKLPRKSSGGPPPPTQMPASVLAQLVGSLGHGAFALAANGPSSSSASPPLPPPGADDAWDFGPMDIKIAEPVVIAGKSSDGLRSGEDASKPVLSRVESLSSSFVDFDLERLEDDQFLVGISGTNIVSSRSHPTEISNQNSGDLGIMRQPHDDVVEFSPPGPGLAAVDLEMFTCGAAARASSHHSRASSTGGGGGGGRGGGGEGGSSGGGVVDGGGSGGLLSRGDTGSPPPDPLASDSQLDLMSSAETSHPAADPSFTVQAAR